MKQDDARGVQDDSLEKSRARYGLFSVIGTNLAIAVVAVVGVWRLDGDRAVIVGVVTAAFTAMSGMTTAYLGIKAVSNTAKSIALGDGAAREQRQPAAPPVTPGPRTP
jgi:hypothetical protein